MRVRRRTAACARALGLIAVLVLASGCTAFDDYLPGSPFTPDPPEGAVTVTGEIHSDRISLSSTGCTPGGTVFWGEVTNTGDVNVVDVTIIIDAFNAAGGGLGSFKGQVFNGEIDDTDPNNIFAGTSLEVDQPGWFKVCTPIPFGAAARTEYRTTFSIVDEVQ